jgi:hypothetical protein
VGEVPAACDTESGKFFDYLATNSNAYWYYDFTGIRAWRVCARRHRRCATHRQQFHRH